MCVRFILKIYIVEIAITNRRSYMIKCFKICVELIHSCCPVNVVCFGGDHLLLANESSALWYSKASGKAIVKNPASIWVGDPFVAN